MSRPHPSQNLISLYGLDDVASSVARKDPKTGEKINRLRKSYENKVKELRIAGKNKATSTPGALLGIVDWPEEEWMNQKVFGKEVERGLQPSVLAKLDKAVQMAPGRLPDSEQAKWRAVVGTDDSSKAKATSGQQATAQNANKKLGKPAATASNRPSAAPSPAPAKALRPERTGTKRRYDESSFKGYGEGYADDDPLGESTGAEDEPRGAGGAKKKRKTKDYPAGSPLGINAGSSGYNPGIVSIRR
ncbi:mediator complex, subunit Med19 [Lineolata rhizophorae]|uniref:Mediator of RNA polymerase II transcription subunit 19 n=1 Tax=Lineolata rhizophorae TaxID=578093 RepID=A0A6A6PAM2_9PEZI|nr:mediator complex, subunit Med19 [Lineolata rhizophorae]